MHVPAETLLPLPGHSGHHRSFCSASTVAIDPLRTWSQRILQDSHSRARWFRLKYRARGMRWQEAIMPKPKSGKPTSKVKQKAGPVTKATRKTKGPNRSAKVKQKTRKPNRLATGPRYSH